MQYNIQVHKIGLLQTGATHFLENMENCRQIFEAKWDDVGFYLHTRLYFKTLTASLRKNSPTPLHYVWNGRM